MTPSSPSSSTLPTNLLDQLAAGPRTPLRHTTTTTIQTPENSSILSGHAVVIPSSHTLSNDVAFPLDLDYEMRPSVSLSHPTKTAFTVSQCLTPNECAALIELSESIGYEVALLNAGTAQILATETRKSDRAMLDDENVAQALWARIKHLVPSRLERHGQTYAAVGLNERLRFLRYGRGGYFVRHMDGTYVRPKDHPKHGEMSMLTYLVYLNENFEGGALEMEWQEAMPPQSCFGKFSQATRNVVIQPTTGVVVVHDHQILHEAMILESGMRYCIRTDVMFAPLLEDGEKVEEERKE